MKRKILSILAISAAVALSGCQKAKVSGKVLDPFSKKPVQNATVWIAETPHQIKTPDGSFSFEEVEFGTYKLSAGKAKYSKSAEEITVDEKHLSVSQDIFIFSKMIKPGLFIAGEGEDAKVKNEWIIHAVQNQENSTFGFRLVFDDKQQKKKIDLPDAFQAKAEADFLFYQATSATVLPEVAIYPLIEDKVSNHKDLAESFEKQKTGLFPILDKKSDLKVSLKSDNLYEITGSLLKGKQALAIYQSGKLLNFYYLEVK